GFFLTNIFKTIDGRQRGTVRHVLSLQLRNPLFGFSWKRRLCRFHHGLRLYRFQSPLHRGRARPLAKRLNSDKNRYTFERVLTAPDINGWGRAIRAEPTVWYDLESMDLHQLAVERSLAFHRVIARRLVQDPAILERARQRVQAWLAATPDRPFAREW